MYERPEGGLLNQDRSWSCIISDIPHIAHITTRGDAPFLLHGRQRYQAKGGYVGMCVLSPWWDESVNGWKIQGPLKTVSLPARKFIATTLY